MKHVPILPQNDYVWADKCYESVTVLSPFLHTAIFTTARQTPASSIQKLGLGCIKRAKAPKALRAFRGLWRAQGISRHFNLPPSPTSL